jgi:hypothetical protein
MPSRVDGLDNDLPFSRSEEDDAVLDGNMLGVAPRETPLILPWPVPGNPGGFLSFANVGEWRRFVAFCGLRPGIPDIVSLKFRRAQKLYFLGWLDSDLIKAAELVALTTLELALKDRYGACVRDHKGKMPFARLLKYMLADGLTDAKIPMVCRSGGTAIGFVSGDASPNLAEIRNQQAHGDPFDGLPYGGLLELVRDLIEFAYRDFGRSLNGRA